MNTLLRFPVTVRLCATVTFLCYLAAGASFSLPSLIACVRCVKQHHPAGMKAGSSCPLSYNGHGHDCHGSKEKAAGAIKLCPSGCLRHEGQDGEIASLVKFLSPPEARFLIPQLTEPLPPEQTVFILARSLSPPGRPPSFLG